MLHRIFLCLPATQVTADSLFLNRMGDQLDKAFLSSRCDGMLTTAIFSMFQNWLKFTSLALARCAIFLFTLSAYCWSIMEMLHIRTSSSLRCTVWQARITAVLLLSLGNIWRLLISDNPSDSLVGSTPDNWLQQYLPLLLSFHLPQN